MPLSLVFVLTALAAHRAVRLAVTDTFPPVEWARVRIENRVQTRHGDDWSDGVRCPWCAGWWISCAVTALVWCWQPLPLPALWFPAVASVAGFLNVYDER